MNAAPLARILPSMLRRTLAALRRPRPTLARAAAAGVIGAAAMVGCGDDGGVAPAVDSAVAATDAAIDADPDAAIDATPDGNPGGPVTVRVQRPRTPSPPLPLAGIQVFASAPDGHLGARAVTDATGEVTLNVVPGGAVTAVLLDDGRRRALSSILGVEPGDVLTIDPEREQLGTTGAGVTYTWPQTPDDDNALAFDAVTVNDGCWHKTVITFAPDPPVPPLPTATTLGLVSGCGTDPRDVVIAHYDTDHLARYAILHDVPATVATRAVSAWALPDTTFTARAVGLAPFVHGYAGEPMPLVNGHSVIGRTELVSPVAGSATFQTPWASALTSVRVHHIVSSDLFAPAECFDDAPPGATQVLFDAATLLPQVSSPRIDAATRRATWMTSPGTSYDETRVAVNYSGPALSPSVAWNLRASGAVSEVRLPDLPVDLAGATLQPTHSTTTIVTLYDLETIDDWPTMRALPFWVPEVDAASSNAWGRACRSSR